jgi:hypothetical protein
MALWFMTVIAGLGTGMMLAMAAMPLDWPAVLWPAMHWCVLVVGIGMAAHAARAGNTQMAIAFVAVALVYNPITQFGSGSPLWSLVGLFAAVPFLVYQWTVPRPAFGFGDRALAAGDEDVAVTSAGGGPADDPANDPANDPRVLDAADDRPGATDAEVAATAKDMYDRYGLKAVAMAKARHGQLVKAGRDRMAREWQKLAAALAALAAAESGEEPAEEGESRTATSAGGPVDIDFEEVDGTPPNKPGAAS